MYRAVVLFTVSLALSACRQGPDAESCTADLLDTDRAFAAYSVEHGPVDAFERFLETGGMQLPNGAPPIFGRDSVVAAMAAGPDFKLDWKPQHAESASACDLGWTWGTYEATFQDSIGATIVSSGKYLNVWRRLDDGSWKVVVDAGNSSGITPRRFHRRAEGNVLESVAFPAAKIELADSFGFVGRFDFVIDGFADGERYVFADANEGHVERLFIAHFEEIYPDSDEIFRYSFDDAMELGGFRFRQNLYGYSNAEAAARNPDGEAAKTARLLRDAGLEFEDEFLMSRYVMVPDEERKREMILFYVENLSSTGENLSDLYADDGRETAALNEISTGIEVRAGAAFTILPR